MSRETCIIIIIIMIIISSIIISSSIFGLGYVQDQDLNLNFIF